MLLLLVQHVCLLVGVGKLQPPDVILVEAVPLQRIDHQRRLKVILKVCEAQNDFLIWVDLPWDQPHRLEPFERTKDVYRKRGQQEIMINIKHWWHLTLTGDFTLCCIDGDSFDVDRVGCVLRNTEDVLAEHGLNVLDDCLL